MNKYFIFDGAKLTVIRDNKEREIFIEESFLNSIDWIEIVSSFDNKNPENNDNFTTISICHDGGYYEHLYYNKTIDAVNVYDELIEYIKRNTK